MSKQDPEEQPADPAVFERIADTLVDHDYVVVGDLFNQDDLEGLRGELIRKLKADELEPAGIGNRDKHTKDETIRSNRIRWIEDHSPKYFERGYMGRIRELKAYLNRTCFSGISDFEFHYACFARHTLYKRHLDRFRSDDARKFSVVTYLNPDWEQAYGGQLVLYLPDTKLHIDPTWSKTVIFRSHIVEHEVLPAERDRMSITGWLK
ncbi:MAG: 2OG-Fe(II) oxygenase [Balneolaceae bacterium]|nr:2OG-Fe(II) oxygenase [Balneolaceae bacterium]